VNLKKSEYLNVFSYLDKNVKFQTVLKIKFNEKKEEKVIHNILKYYFKVFNLRCISLTYGK